MNTRPPREQSRTKDFFPLGFGAQLDGVFGGIYRLLVDFENNVAPADAHASRGGIGLDLHDHGTLELRGNVELLAGLGIDVVHGDALEHAFVG